MRGNRALANDVTVRPGQKNAERLVGYVFRWMPEGKYGFIRIRGVKDADGSNKQWHFHANSLRGVRSDVIAVGVVVRFTSMPCPAEGKRDKAIDIEVVG